MISVPQLNISDSGAYQWSSLAALTILLLEEIAATLRTITMLLATGARY